MNSTPQDSSQAVTVPARLSRFFFMHIGSFVAVFVYFYVRSQTGFSADGVPAALLTGLVVMSSYIALALYMGELKQFDFGLWLMFALGAGAAYAGVDIILRLFLWYSPAMLFLTLGLVALIPLLLGRETFTYYFARRQTPPWQQKLPVFHRINRVMTIFWALLFFTCAGLAAYAPADWRFNTLYPNALIFLVGIPAGFWLPLLDLKLFPMEPPNQVEPLIMGLPFAFNRAAAQGARAIIQFNVSGAEAGAYYIQVNNGKCQSFAGHAPAPDLTIHTPDTVWRRIARNELDGAQAFQEGLYTAEGDLSILSKFREWFSKESGTRRV
ncbi:MAG TPA: SCP2 sterol-binding domain-containing protein [Methylomirabilota bacterium]|jgi:putative sterol carrier protein|nr:SCP2 sterol-binding domain-containing protein [Methylomirabilota bacterium]